MRRKRHDYPDAEVETERGEAQSSQATKNCRGSETADARERRSTRDRDLHVSSCNDMLAMQKMSLATFHIELGLYSMCMSRLHALYLMLRTSYSMCMYL